jgi:hypothetical protein
VVLAGLLVGADRLGLLLAEHVAQNKLANYTEAGTKPQVSVHGFPFLTQAIRGKYSDIEVTSSNLQVGDFTSADLDVHLRGAHLPLGTVLGGNLKELPVDRVDGTVTLPYDELAKLSKIPGLTLTAQGDQVRAAATVSIPGIGVGLPVAGLGSLRLNGQAVDLSVSRLTVAGVAVPASVLDQVTNTLKAGIPLPSLPYGLTIGSAATGPDGLVVSGSGTNVTLRPLS